MSAPAVERSRSGYAMVASAAVLWGTWSLFLIPARVDARWSTTLVFATITLFGAPLLLRPVARNRRPRNRGDGLRMAIFGLGDAANAGLFFLAMQYTTVAIAVLSHYLAPVLVALLAPRWFGTPAPRGAIRRAVLATAGLVVMLEPWKLTARDSRHIVGAAFGLASAFFYAMDVCLSKDLSERFTVEESVVYHSFVSTLVALPFALAVPLPSQLGALRVVVGGLVVGLSTALLFVRGLSRIPPEHASLLTFLEPLAAVLIGAIVWHQRMTPYSIAGAVLILATGIAAARTK